MNRRDFILNGISWGTGTLAAVALPKALAQTIQPKAGQALTPYGAERLSNTDLHKLTDSLRQQLIAAGQNIPDIFTPFPKKSHGDPVMTLGANGTQPVAVIGETEKKPYLEQIHPDFDRLFAGQQPCSLLTLLDKFTAWRVFVGLHEVAHDVAIQSQKDGANLNMYVFNNINKVPVADTATYLATLQEFPSEKASERTLVAEATVANVPERLADTAAALYILSNYRDIEDSKAFLRDIMDFRTSYYLGGNTASVNHPQEWIISWNRGNTASSIQAAIDAYQVSPRQGMSIIEATQMAASVIVNQPEFKKSIHEMAVDITDKMSAKAVLWFGIHNEAFNEVIVKNSAARRDAIQRAMADIVDARNRACKLPVTTIEPSLPSRMSRRLPKPAPDPTDPR